MHMVDSGVFRMPLMISRRCFVKLSETQMISKHIRQKIVCGEVLIKKTDNFGLEVFLSVRLGHLRQISEICVV